MQIMSELSSEMPQNRGESATAFKNRSGWLQELENAQWQQRGHSRTNGEKQPRNLQSVESETPAVITAKGMTQKQIEPMQADRHIASLARYDGVRMSPQHVDVVAQIRSLPGNVEDAGSLLARVIPLMSSMGDLNEPDALPGTIGTSRSKPVEWLSQYTHLDVDGREVNMWIRDARIKESGLEILSRLRNCLKSLGLRLENLTINGLPVGKKGNSS